MRYILIRILWMIPTFVGIVTITFFLTKLRPDPITQKLLSPEGLKEGSAAEKYIEELRKYYGLDKPLYVQYFIMWKNLLTLNLGKSRIDHRPVKEKILEALPYTLLLNLISIFIVYLISIPLGIFFAMKEGSFLERWISFFLYFLYSLPTFWVGIVLLRYLAGGDFLDLFPLGGIISDNFEELTFTEKIQDILWHLFLPVVTSVYGSFAFLSRFVRNSYLETLKAEYIRLALSYSLPRWKIYFVYALRNALIPLVTISASLLPALFSGSVIIETIFSIPGMGKLAYDSIYTNDETVIIAIVAFSSILTLIGIFIADLLYLWVDPRIRFEKGEIK